MSARWTWIDESLAKEWPLAAVNRDKTHCPQGHPYSGDNLFRRLDGRRECKACKREQGRRDREKHRDRIRETKRHYRETNRRQVNERNRRYRERNREAINERARAANWWRKPKAQPA